MTTRRPGSFIATREHRRFIEFADAVRRHATIGLCHGPAGVGKTLSARRYAHWDLAEPLLTDWGPRATSDEKVYAALARSRTLFYTPVVAGAMATMRKDISLLINRVSACIEQGLSGPGRNAAPIGRLELIIIDEAERLTTTTLEYLRDQFDRSDTGLILIGMPGIERRMARYPQLYSRIGFSHRYAPLSKDELAFVLKRHWQHRGQEMSDDDFTDAQVMAAIARLTGGNFRLLQRLFVQVIAFGQVGDQVQPGQVDVAKQRAVVGLDRHHHARGDIAVDLLGGQLRQFGQDLGQGVKPARHLSLLGS